MNGYNGYNGGGGGNPIPQDTVQQFVWAIKTCFNKYADFTGRASRAEFWWWILFSFLIQAACAGSQWLEGVITVALIVPTIAVGVRRLHDTGRGGGWWCINFIPLVGQILYIVWCAQQGELHPNRFGPNPYGYNDGQPPIIR